MHLVVHKEMRAFCDRVDNAAPKLPHKGSTRRPVTKAHSEEAADKLDLKVHNTGKRNTNGTAALYHAENKVCIAVKCTSNERGTSSAFVLEPDSVMPMRERWLHDPVK